MFFLRLKTFFLLAFLSTVSAFISQHVEPFSTSKETIPAFNSDTNIVKKKYHVKMNKTKSKLFAMIGFEEQNSMTFALNTFESLSGTNVAFITLVYSSAVYFTVKQNMKDESTSQNVVVEKIVEDVIEKSDESLDTTTDEEDIKEITVDTSKSEVKTKKVSNIDIVNAKKKVASTAQGEKEKNRLLKQNEEEEVEEERIENENLDEIKDEENISEEEASEKTKKKSFRQRLKRLAKKAIAPWRKVE